MPSSLTLRPLTMRTWKDFETLFGANGACGGCWCMWWRLRRSEYLARRGAGNKRSMKKIVSGGEIPGIIAYVGNEPVAWCSLGPREWYAGLERSKVLARIDDKKVWSIVCFYIRKEFRRTGLLESVLRAAVGYARKNGARCIEAYPIDVRKETASLFLFTGVAGPFIAAGFVEAGRRSPTRPIMRLTLRRP